MVTSVGWSPPDGLPELSELEEMYISRIHPVMACYRKKGGQSGMKGHCANIFQEHVAIQHSLPPRIEDMPVYLAVRPCNVDAEADFTPLIVRRHAVFQWLTFLQKNNALYSKESGFSIDLDALAALPDNGIPTGIRKMYEGGVFGVDGPDMADLDEDMERHPCEDNNEDDSVEGPTSHSFFPNSKFPQTETVSVKRAAAFQKFNARKPDVPIQADNTVTVNWPKLLGIVNERNEARGYAAMSFPTLFPYGPAGDPTVLDRKVDVDLQLAFKHLLQFGVKRDDGTVTHPFAQHRRFPFWALNVLQRKQLLSRSNYYFTQNPSDAVMSLEDMQAILDDAAAAQALHARLRSSTASMMGTDAFWGRKAKQLEALVTQKKDPHIFFTMSIADNHFPEFHRLVTPEGAESTPVHRHRTLYNVQRVSIPSHEGLCATLRPWCTVF